MLETLTRESFAPHVGAIFHIQLPNNQSLDTTLVETTAIGTVPPGSAVRAPFSLVFKGPATPVLPQQIYRLEQATLGTLDLFLVPIGPSRPEQGRSDQGAGGMLYEAIFT